MRLALIVWFAMGAAAFGEPVPAVIQGPVVNLFSKASLDGSVVSQAIFGANVHILEEQPSWWKIRTADQYTGWIEPSDALKRDVYAVSGSIAVVKGLFASLYREKSITRHQPVLTLPFEARLEVIAEPEDEDRRWIQVRLPNGRDAWMQRGDLNYETNPITREEMLTMSRRFLGLPYLWGGTSTYGYDCSGFTQMLFRQTGLLLPRDAQPQADWSGMTAISKEELRPGDLLYFGTSDKKITHTGMYLGDGQFIHATAHLTPAVQISRLSEERWSRLLVASRRAK